MTPEERIRVLIDTRLSMRSKAYKDIRAAADLFAKEHKGTKKFAVMIQVDVGADFMSSPGHLTGMVIDEDAYQILGSALGQIKIETTEKRVKP